MGGKRAKRRFRRKIREFGVIQAGRKEEVFCYFRHGTRGRKRQGFSLSPALILAAFGTDPVDFLDNL